MHANSTDIKDWGITLLLPEINTPKPSTNESFEEGQSKNSFILESEDKLKSFFQYLTDVMSFCRFLFISSSESGLDTVQITLRRNNDFVT